MANKVSISSQLASHPSPSMQFLVILMAISKMEITIGKLSTAMRMVLLLALAAMLDKRVSEAAKPREVSSINMANSVVSWIGLPKNKTKSTYPEKDKTAQSRKLYPILERIMEAGWAIE